jgi:hypothetical protein
MLNRITAIALIGVCLLASGCKDAPRRRPVDVTQEVTVPGKAPTPRPPRKEAQEYDCRKHDPDKVCLVPWKDKTVMYCYKGVIPKVVRYRSECK